ncbi:MAG: hypothetical protein Q8R00_01245 [Candidatus Nanoarchaeia archaeon]|nr:hypothetical protein [Candidatus Nanoarchaeia archaeon]
MAAEDQVILILYVLLGAVAGIIYALRRIILLERRLIGMEDTQIRIEKSLLAKVSRSAPKSSKRKKRR